MVWEKSDGVGKLWPKMPNVDTLDTVLDAVDTVM